jgi:hypothetical protein
MAQTTRQTNLLVEQDWTKVYQSFSNADFTSYDFETLRNSMIEYIKTYYPETFNDFIESSEYLALIDCIAFLGQSLSFRSDLNARENFLDTAQRRDSILKLSRMLSYNPTRSSSATGLVKIDSVQTTETITDSSGINLSGVTVNWNDLTNDNWLEQFTTIINSALVSRQALGKPGNSQVLNGIQTDEYSIRLNPNSLPVAKFNVNLLSTTLPFEAVSATSVGQSYIYEVDPTVSGRFNILYRNDNNGNGSNDTGMFLYFKQGNLQATDINFQNAIPNNFVQIATNNINNNDHWLYQLGPNNSTQTLWGAVPALTGVNVIYNQESNKNLYQINSLSNDQVGLVFGDGSFSNIPQGNFRFYYRTNTGANYSVTPDDMSSVSVAFSYISSKNTVETLTVTASLKYTVTNATSTQSLNSIKSYAPQQYYTQNRMITGEDYNILPLTTFTSIQKVKAVNRTSSGISLYLDSLDPTKSYSSTNIFGEDGTITANTAARSLNFDFLTSNDIYNAIYNDVIPAINSTGMRNYYYANYQRYNSPYANVTFFQTANSTVSSSGYLQYAGNTLQVGTGVTGNLQYIAPGATVQFTSNSSTFYSAVAGVVAATDPTTPNLIRFANVVPTGAVITGPGLLGNSSIIPTYKNDLSSSLISTMVSQIAAKTNFGLTYDQVNQVWKNIPPSNIGTTPDSGWLMKFNYNQGLYNIEYKTLAYTFSSTGSTKFYYDPTVKVYDSLSGENITDSIKLLKINTKPGGAQPMDTDVIWQVYDIITAVDGYVDDSKILVKSPSSHLEGVPDDPDLYTTTAGSSTSRDNLYFRYKHNSPSRNRIDPTPINIIDLYILTSEYTRTYAAWLRDLTGTLTQPTPPTSSTLEIDYSELDNYKTVSDSIVYNPAKFKPLFGAKADPSLQARFQVVKNPAVNITDNEIKSQVISAINRYFDVGNWDFGDTFYFSELSAYLHSTLAPNIASILIVPASDSLVFGNYFQINSEPWEIITSAATVNDIDIIGAVTAAQLNLGNNLVGTY